MRKYAAVFLVCVGIMFSSSAVADERAEKAAEKLLDLMGMESTLAGMLDASLDEQIAQKPEMGPFKGVMRAFFAKYMGYERLKPKIAAAYAAEFTAEELEQLSAFYSTPAGRKFLQKMPSLFAKGAQIGQEAVAEHIPELQQAIQQESQRLQALQSQADRK